MELVKNRKDGQFFAYFLADTRKYGAKAVVDCGEMVFHALIWLADFVFRVVELSDG